MAPRLSPAGRRRNAVLMLVGPCCTDVKDTHSNADCQAFRATREAGRAARAPTAGRDAARHARAAKATAERRGEAVLHRPLGPGGQAGHVRAAKAGGVAARGRGHRVRELVPRHADRHAARRTRQLRQAEGAAGGGHVLLGVRLRDPADRREARPGAARRLRQCRRAHGADDGAVARARTAQARLLHQGGVLHAGERRAVRRGDVLGAAGRVRSGARQRLLLDRDELVQGGRAHRHMPQPRGYQGHSGRAGAGRGLRQVQHAGHRLAARGVTRSGAGGAGAAAGGRAGNVCADQQPGHAAEEHGQAGGGEAAVRGGAAGVAGGGWRPRPEHAALDQQHGRAADGDGPAGGGEAAVRGGAAGVAGGGWRPRPEHADLDQQHGRAADGDGPAGGGEAAVRGGAAGEEGDVGRPRPAHTALGQQNGRAAAGHGQAGGGEAAA
eukprot:scaffold58742_cov56-Phaeocystis_antarctica.AAC.2